VSALIDAHHHFLEPARTEYPWLTPELARIDRRFGPEDLALELAGAGVDRSILVQTISSSDETREFLATAATTPFIAGVIGWVDLTDAAVAGSIDAARAGSGGDRLVGIRHQVHDEPDPSWLLRDDVRRGLAAVETASLTYDLLVRPRELSAALAVVRAQPSLRFVIDHLAKPPIASGDLASWASRLRPFGALENAWCKLSGLVTETDWQGGRGWRVTDLAPPVEIALEIFGPSRLIFGSDWPVCLLAASYPEVVSVARELTAGLSDAERAAVFGGAAERAYSLSIAPNRV
jgi:L-fuconolactonase